MVKEYGPDEQWKQLLRMFLVVAVGLGIWIGIGVATDDGPDQGPCEQYTSQEAFEACADAYYNR
jgi:hypothetical protein